jgi:predicted dehydrogenase
MSIRFAVLGIDHRHAFGMTEHLIAAGASCAGWWTDGNPGTEGGFVKRFPDLPRVSDRDAILERSDIDLVVIAAIPRDRAALAIEAMRAGKDVMVDKPGCTTMDQLADLRAVQAETGRIWSIDFSERFEVPSVTLADELVRAGAIGRVVQTVGLGPHRLNRATRPDWFFDRMAYGGILTDIASHQIDQFLHFTGSQEAEITHRRGRELRPSRRSRPAGFRRDRAPSPKATGLYPGRLVHARCAAQLGRRAADDPGNGGVYRAQEIRRCGGRAGTDT